MRTGSVKRITKETRVEVKIDLDGRGKHRINTTIPFLDHMLALFAHHGNFGLRVDAKGDTGIDNHHLVEDLGITLGEAFSKALGDKKKIGRYGSFLLPMDEALSYIAVDISGRPYLRFDVKFNREYRWLKSEFNFDLLEDFFSGFVSSARATLHISLKHGRSNHHISESIFKGFGRALAQAAAKDAGRRGIPSTKGRI